MKKYKFKYQSPKNSHACVPLMTVLSASAFEKTHIWKPGKRMISDLGEINKNFNIKKMKRKIAILFDFSHKFINYKQFQERGCSI